MARIPEDELERLKSEVSVERLVEASGIELKRSGKDWLGRCPFHADETASLVVTPAKNLWHCFGCGVGGGPIDWVMRRRGVSFRHAVELLREGVPGLAEGQARAQVKRGTIKALPAPVAFDADDQALLRQAAAYYHERLLATSEARAYLAARGLEHPELVERFRLGVADRTLGLRLPDKTRKAGADIRTRLQRVGLYRESGHEHFNGSLVVPVLDAEGQVVEVYGRKLQDNLRAGTPKHLYLPGPHAGVWNLDEVRASAEVIVCESLIDAMTFWCAGLRNVTAAYGVEGVTDDLLAVLAEPVDGHARRVLIAFDRDDAGERGATKLAETLMARGVDCWRVQFPRGMDANEYALKVQPAAKSLALLVRKARWLGKGEAPALTVEPASTPAAATAAKEETPSSLAAEPASPAPVLPPATTPAVTPPAAVPHEVQADADASIEVEGDVLRLVCGARTWAVRGMPKVHPGASLKLNVRVQQATDAVRPVAALHVDSVDLYSARSRAVFAAQAAAELGGRDSEALQRELSRELGRVLLAVEQAIERREREASAPKQVAPTMSDAEHEAALAWLKAPDLLQRIAADFDACGLVGEATNKLTAYLACVSRLLASPLAVLVQSSSAAGKTSLMDAVLAFMPEEARIRYSAMTGQSLYYMGQTDLKHRILALAEEEGAARASYALKLLQSDGELTMAATGKDPTTGALVTQEYHVEGPVMLMLTTTAIDIDEELMNRCLVLTVDEGAQQTQAIHARQRERRTLAGLLAKQNKHDIQTLHRHAQRLLKPLAVVNPYAEQLSFHARHARARRDHEKYLTLIDAIALLHQHQRPVRQAQARGQAIEYIEVTRADIEAAHALAHDVLGRSLDELPPVTRKLLRAVSGYVAERAHARGVPVEDVRFTRRELREACGWGDTQLRLHLERLAALELVASERSGRGGQVHYWLQCATDDEGRTRLSGLADPSRLVKPEATTTKSRGAVGEVAGLASEGAAMSRGDEPASKPASMRGGAKVAGDAGRTDRAEAVNGRSYTYPPYPQAAASA
jgi:DNA primase catalytic core